MACLAAVVGLSIERAILLVRSVAFDPPGGRWIAVAGADPGRAEALAEQLIQRGATALLSFGIAGGIDASAQPGLLVLASEVVLPDGTRMPTDPTWRAQLTLALRGLEIRVGPIAGADQMVTAIDKKADLQRKTMAIAVDMESHGVARAATRHAVPFLVLRAIADPANRSLPASVTSGLDAAGAMQPLKTMAALLAAPSEIPKLLGVTADVAVALAALWRLTGSAGRNLRPI